MAKPVGPAGRAKTIDTPLLQVTGFVLAEVVAGKGNVADRWRFYSSELSGTYADWLRSQSEVRFAESQLAKTRELVEAETHFLTSVVKRLNPLVGNSSVPEAEILKAKADLSKAQLTGEKDIFSAESTLQAARNRQAALERELAQAGVDVAVFSDAVENMVLVVASVPEGRVSQVRAGQACRVRFYGYPDRQFPAHVESLSSLISQDRRTLRVLFELNDAQSLLKPGMFADVGLGAESRQAVLVPYTAVLHAGRLHYLLVADGDGAWQVTPVKVGDVHSDRVEIISGVEPPAKIVSQGGILLKPLVMQALRAADERRAMKHRPMVRTMKYGRWPLAICLLVALGGAWSCWQEPLDAYPDISPPQVLVISEFPGRAPEEIERQVTIPIELAMDDVPNAVAVRSRTIMGLSVVELIFELGTEKYFAPAQCRNA